MRRSFTQPVKGSGGAKVCKNNLDDVIKTVLQTKGLEFHRSIHLEVY